MNPSPPPFPHDKLKDAVGEDSSGHDALESLRRQLEHETPDKAEVERHVSLLKELPAVRPLIEQWLEAPSTQHWLQVLSNIGL